MEWLKKSGESALVGSLVFVGGNYLLPLVDKLTFIPTNNLFLGLGVDDVVAFGAAAYGAVWLSKKAFKSQ